MDPLETWRDALERILTEHTEVPYSNGDIHTEVIVDRKRGRYLLVDLGWQGPERVHGALVHVDEIDGKFWIQCDGTEEGVATQLVTAGVPKDRIVLAFKHPDLRGYTDFAAA
jgi:XisI protein